MPFLAQKPDAVLIIKALFFKEKLGFRVEELG